MSKIAVICFSALLLSGCYHKGDVRLPSLAMPKPSSTTPYLYAPPTVHRTFITAQATPQGFVEASHYVYWVDEAGHWQLPLANSHHQKDTHLIEPGMAKETLHASH